MTSLPRILKQGKAKLRDNEIDVAVLDDQTRILISDGTRNDPFLGKLPSFIETYKTHASTLANHIKIDVDTAHIEIAADKIIPMVDFEAQDGTKGKGYNHLVLFKIAETYFKYSDYLRKNSETAPDDYAEAIEFASDLMLNLAYIGVAALVDEATGYEKVRPKTELQDTLNKLLAPATETPLTNAIN